MKEMTHFSPEVCEKIGSYVYRLIDPRNGQTFYVGKGKGNRVFAHVYDALKSYDGVNYEDKTEDDICAKIKLIREIHNAGLEVIHVIQRWGLTENSAFEVESAIIDCFPGLSNVIDGHDTDRGVTSALELEKSLALKLYTEPDFKYIIIKTTSDRVNCDFCHGSLYEATRYAWRLNRSKLDDYHYAFGVIKGVVKGVYEIDRWEKAEENRWQFHGHEASEELKERFIDHRLPDYYVKKGMASPVLYSDNFNPHQK